jgi:cysteine desulfurase
VIWVPVNGVGLVDPLDILNAVQGASQNGRRKGLVTIAMVNSEIGTVQDIAAICNLLTPFRPPLTVDGDISPNQSVWVHTDAVQAIGHIPVNVTQLGVDFLTLAAHKFHGPPGVGLLWCRGVQPPTNRQAMLHGGHQQDGWRPGTEPVTLIIGMAEALKYATRPNQLSDNLELFAAMCTAVWHVLFPFIVTGVVLPTGPDAPPVRVSNHISFCVRNTDRNWVVTQLDKFGISASGGSACNTSVALPSDVLVAIGVPPEYIRGSVRLTFSHTNTLHEVNEVLCPALKTILDALARESVQS